MILKVGDRAILNFSRKNVEVVLRGVRPHHRQPDRSVFYVSLAEEDYGDCLWVHEDFLTPIYVELTDQQLEQLQAGLWKLSTIATPKIRYKGLT